MKQVWVLGDGQLGRMLRQAGEPLGIMVQLTGDNQLTETESISPSVITAEIERWAQTPLTQYLEQHPAFINQQVFPLIADRLTQKQLLTDLHLPVAGWRLLTDRQQWSQLFAQLGSKLVVKRRTGGYDGRGQWRINASNEHSITTLPADCYGQSIVEQVINFSDEVSLIGARNQHGTCVFFPLTHNLHQAGILRASIVLPKTNAQQHQYQQQAQEMLSAIMHRLNYVGVMAMECFVTPAGLLINELAPRVHNSGHWTQNGATISQFSLHLCAILDLPITTPLINTPSVMINLLGCELNYQWLRIPYLHLHWYHKQVRSGRKVGHLNLNTPDTIHLCQALQDLSPLLPDDHQPVIDQVRKQLDQSVC